jgi:hypothetical protein
MTPVPRELEIEIVQRPPCQPFGGACMAVVVAPGAPCGIESGHVCNDPRAIAARGWCARLATDARKAGFAGPIVVHFPPGTFGSHTADATGRLMPTSSGMTRPGR